MSGLLARTWRLVLPRYLVLAGTATPLQGIMQRQWGDGRRTLRAAVYANALIELASLVCVADNLH
jgi:hypothetical protein